MARQSATWHSSFDSPDAQPHSSKAAATGIPNSLSILVAHIAKPQKRLLQSPPEEISTVSGTSDRSGSLTINLKHSQRARFTG